jgi:hypothetical protein
VNLAFGMEIIQAVEELTEDDGDVRLREGSRLELQ